MCYVWGHCAGLCEKVKGHTPLGMCDHFPGYNQKLNKLEGMVRGQGRYEEAMNRDTDQSRTNHICHQKSP